MKIYIENRIVNIEEKMLFLCILCCLVMFKEKKKILYGIFRFDLSCFISFEFVNYEDISY